MNMKEVLNKLRAEIERLKSTNPSEYNYQNAEGYTWALDDLLSFLDTLSEEPDKSLEEAANEFCKTIFHKPFSENPQEEQIVYDGDRYVGFIAGAKWQSEHTPLPEDTVIFNKGVAEGKRLMLEGAVEKTVGQLERQCGGNFHFMHGFEVDEMDFPFLNSQECGYGDKVRIIVCKKED